MADEAATVRRIEWREVFPFTHLFRAFRIAIHPSKLIIALVALACLWCGGLILDALWPQRFQTTPDERVELVSLDLEPGRVNVDNSEGVFSVFFNHEVTQANHVLMFHGEPFESVWRFIAIGPLWLWSHHWLFALLYTAWFLLIWSVFGGAISRIAAVHVARDEKISVRHAMSFSTAKVLSFVFAPIIPVFIVMVIGLIIAVVSTTLFHIPHIGPLISSLTFFLALIGGFVIALVLLGTIGGFNLMYPTVAVEGSDSFDAISRSFSYIFARPWRMLWYTLVSVVYGSICYLFVRFFVWLVLAVTWFFMTWMLGTRHTPALDTLHSPADVFSHMWQRPLDPLATLPHQPDYPMLGRWESTSAGIMQFWIYLVIGLIGAFAISFYFSANTIIYYLMRREVDATDLDDVYVEDTDDDLDVADAGPAEATVTTVVVADEVPPPPEIPA